MAPIPPKPALFVAPLPENPITGTSSAKTGVTGSSNMGVGVLGTCIGGPGADVTPASDGVVGIGKNGVHGQSASATDSGVWGENTGAGVGVAGSSVTGNAGEFTGDVLVNGKLTVTGNVQHGGNLGVTGTVTVQGDVVLANADCAEDFDIAESAIEPGTVVILDESGRIRCCREEYDKRVAGVISGAGDFRPGIVLDRQKSKCPRMPVALFGKVFCKVDASHSPIAVGDALTTSATPGHAMKATDRGEAFGAVIGKALGRLDSGTGQIPMLIALQ